MSEELVEKVGRAICEADPFKTADWGDLLPEREIGGHKVSDPACPRKQGGNRCQTLSPPLNRCHKGANTINHPHHLAPPTRPPHLKSCPTWELKQ